MLKRKIEIKQKFEIEKHVENVKIFSSKRFSWPDYKAKEIRRC